PFHDRLRRDDRRLPRWHDRARDDGSERTGVVHRERSAIEVVEGQPTRLRAIDDVTNGAHQAGEALSVGVADHRHDETLVAECDRVTEVDLLVRDDALISEARVHERYGPERLDRRLADERGGRQVEALA